MRYKGRFQFITIFSLICVLVFMLLGCGTASPTAPEPTAPEPTPAVPETFELKYAGMMPPGSEVEIVPEWWAGEVEKRTGGRVKVALYPGGALGQFPDFPDMLKGGVCDLALLGADPTTPGLGVVSLPFIFPNRAVCTDVIYALYYQGLFEGLSQYKVLWFQPTELSLLFLRDKKVESQEDFEGLQLRGPGGAFAAFPDALGATGVVIPGPDCYMALERGMIDGTISMLSFYRSANLNEVLKYGVREPIMSGAMYVAMNLDVWNSLPLDIQVIIQELNAEARYRFVNLYATPEEDYVFLADSGLELYELSAEERERWHEVGQQFVDEWVAQMEAQGLPGEEIIDITSRIVQLYK